LATFLRAKFAHHENEKNGTRLSSWFVRADRKRHQEQALASVVLETGKALPKMSGGDEKTGRGVPIIGMGRGAIAGTSPDVDLANRLDRLRESIDKP
jgi:hypothetical protein